MNREEVPATMLRMGGLRMTRPTSISILKIILCRKNTQLTWRVSEEADLPLTILAVLASLGPIPGRVQPALKHTMSKLAVVPTRTRPGPPVLRTDSAGIVVATRVTATSLLARVGKWAVGPVVAAAAGALTDLELVHPELVRRVGVRVGVEPIVARVPVAGEELLDESGGIGVEEARGGIGVGGGAAGEELPWWDVEVL